MPLRPSLCRLSRQTPTSIRRRTVAKKPPGNSRLLGRERAAVEGLQGQPRGQPHTWTGHAVAARRTSTPLRRRRRPPAKMASQQQVPQGQPLELAPRGNMALTLADSFLNDLDELAQTLVASSVDMPLVDGFDALRVQADHRAAFHQFLERVDRKTHVGGRATTK